ncbi:MAG TPA: NAD(P)/FAD-dependent oxidoreductase [Candidatus Binatia bacterium]|nr:NAD(P)/FAD-dependent oxidoreductase [Candidatus Binatia bacterium]
MPLEGRHVAVVGAGIGGIAAALLLARGGARVTLFERDPEPRTVRAGLLLQPNGLAVLYGLDLDERLQRRGARVSQLRVADAAGATLFDVPIPRFAAGLDHALVLRRREVLAALVDLVVAEPGVERRFGTEVDAVTADGSVAFRTPKGPATLRADLVVGADGVHSRVRKASRVDARVSHGFRYVRGLGPPMRLDGMTEYWTSLGIFGLAPVDHGTYFYGAADAQPLATAIEEQDVELFRRAWAAALPAAGEALAGVRRFQDLLVNEVRRVDCARWVDGAVVLLGDAAHAMAPNLGQGAGSALVDAVVLAWELAQPGEPAAALARYERRRRPAVRAVQDLTDRLAWLASVHHPALRGVRDAAVRLLGSWVVGEVPLRLVEQEDPLWLRLTATAPAAA